jgi:hypothetical protein
MVTFEVDAEALADARRRGNREVALPAAWLAGCLVALLLLPVWVVPVLLPLALVFGLIALAGLLRLRRTRRPDSDTLTLTDAGVRYAGELVDWAHVRSVLAYPNTERLEVRTGCPEPIDGPRCDHGGRGRPRGRRWTLSAELFGTGIDSLVHAFGRYVAVEEHELLSEDRLRGLFGRRTDTPDRG